jgi:predicted TIM-barrel fold metal-dependent hydrolase
MSERMKIDMHTHVWPDALAKRALGSAFPELARRGDGRVTSLRSAMSRAGLDAAVCLGVAGEPRHVRAVNRFAASLTSPLIGFGSVHPEVDPDELVRDLREHHLKGVKIHPIVQEFALDDERLRPILEALSGEFVTVIHVGLGGSERVMGFASPDKLRLLVKAFPRLDVIACHFGGYRMLDSAYDEVVGLPIYLDTSWPPSLAGLDVQRVADLVQRHGPDRILFGSDWPMADIGEELEAIQRLELPDWQINAIMGGNAQRLLSLREV